MTKTRISAGLPEGNWWVTLPSGETAIVYLTNEGKHIHCRDGRVLPSPPGVFVGPIPEPDELWKMACDAERFRKTTGSPTVK